DEDDVRIDGVDAGQELRGALDAHDVHIAGLPQALFQDRSANRVFVDDHNVQGGIHRHVQWFKRCANPRLSGNWLIFRSLPQEWLRAAQAAARFTRTSLGNRQCCRRYLCGSRGAELVTAAFSTDENADALAGSMRLANLRNSLIPCSGLAGRLRMVCVSV